jgi:peptide methionine sulfoxide reductase MsrB
VMSDVIKIKRSAADDDNRQDKKKWKEKIHIEEYERCRMKATELRFSGKNWNHKQDSVCGCVVCANELFETEFDSGTGCLILCVHANLANLKHLVDNNQGMQRVEVQYNTGGADLGHPLMMVLMLQARDIVSTLRH